MDYSPSGSAVHGILQQEYWRGLPCPPLGDLPNLRIEPTSLTSLALAGGVFTISTTWEVERSFPVLCCYRLHPGLTVSLLPMILFSLYHLSDSLVYFIASHPHPL